MLARELTDVVGASSDSRMHECRSSSMSRCLSANEAVFMLLVVEADRCVRRLVKRNRTSNGSAMVGAVWVVVEVVASVVMRMNWFVRISACVMWEY